MCVVCDAQLNRYQKIPACGNHLTCSLRHLQLLHIFYAFLECEMKARLWWWLRELPFPFPSCYFWRKKDQIFLLLFYTSTKLKTFVVI